VEVQQHVREAGELMDRLLLPRTDTVAVGQAPDDQITVTAMQLRQHYGHHAPTKRLDTQHKLFITLSIEMPSVL